MIYFIRKWLVYFCIGAACIAVSLTLLQKHTRILEKNHFAMLKRGIAWGGLRERINSHLVQFKGNVGIQIEDLSRNWRISINTKNPFPSASMVKIAIMASCFEAAEKGELNLDQPIALRNSNKTSGSGELKHFRPGSQFTINELMERMICESDNTAANMLIDLLGFDYLNHSFKRLGLIDTTIVRKMLDFRYRKIGVENFTTAADISRILKDMYCARLINKNASQCCLAILKRQKVNDRIPARLPPETTVAHKTGLENGVCHDAGIVYTPHGDFLICVLTKHSYPNARMAKRLIATIASDVYYYAVANE